MHSSHELVRASQSACRFTLSLLLPWLLAGAVSASEFQAYQLTVPGVEQAVSMVAIEGGTFFMGSEPGEPDSDDSETPRHEVVVGDFWMSQYEVSWQEYEVFVALKPSAAELVSPQQLEALSIDGVTGATTPYVDMSFGMGKNNTPAVGMTQYAAQMYARWLSAVTGQFYRLPTEAEWEYACRAGTTTAWSFGATADEADNFAVFEENSDSRYAARGTKRANPWSLYDMHGNVAEWTLDAYTPAGYDTTQAVDPWKVPQSLYPRVARGGSWYHDVTAARCASRLPSRSEWKERDPQLPKSRWWHTNAPFIGFRLVRPRIQPTAEDIATYWPEPIDDYGM